MVRLGDGTDLSRAKMQTAVDDLWRYTGELTTPDDTDLAAAQSGLGPNLTDIHHAWNQTVNAVLEEATLTRPADTWMQSGGKQGRHKGAPRRAHHFLQVRVQRVAVLLQKALHAVAHLPRKVNHGEGAGRGPPHVVIKGVLVAVHLRGEGARAFG